MIAESGLVVQTLDAYDLEMLKIDIRPEGTLEPVLDLPAAMNPARVYLASLSGGSRGTMRHGLDMAAGVLTFYRCDHLTCPWWLLRIGHTKALRAWLADNTHFRTANKVLSAVRGTLRAAWEMEQIPSEDYTRAISVRNIRGQTIPQAAGRALTPGEKAAILLACQQDQTPAGPRDAAIFGLGVFGGLRRAEVASLKIADYDLDRQVMTVSGKGNKARTVHVATGVDDALADWLHVRGDRDGRLFWAINRGGRILTGQGISGNAIYEMVARRAKAAGVKFFTPHDLRRTFAGDLLDAGADIAIVQQLMGHANANTTAGYDRRGERAKRAAIGKLHMAYERRYTDAL